jgi:type IV pilus assembly protein PilP
MHRQGRQSVRHTRIAALIAVTLVVSACGSGRGDLEDWVTEVKARRGAPLEPLPVLKTFDAFAYSAFDMREPFSIWEDDEDRGTLSATAGPRPDPNRRKEALESFPLDALDMVGTIGMGADMFALVKAPDGVVYRSRPSNYLGQSDGRITGIFEDRIELVELIPNGVGGWIEQPALIPLENQ